MQDDAFVAGCVFTAAIATIAYLAGWLSHSIIF